MSPFKKQDLTADDIGAPAPNGHRAFAAPGRGAPVPIHAVGAGQSPAAALAGGDHLVGLGLRQARDAPNLPEGNGKTDLTVITDKPTCIDEFMRSVFLGLAEPDRPFVAGFPGNPNGQKLWAGQAWVQGQGHADIDVSNWYFSLGVYRPTEDGYHRQEKNCTAVFGVMLDDIGTKALPLDRLAACPPSYVIETSPGNFQAGYLFAEPITDLKLVKALNASLVQAGLCDPGAKSPPTRYGRLPFGINGKKTPTFPCTLANWHPERRYTVQEIVERLELTLEPTGAAKRSPTRRAGHQEGVYAPRPNENEVVAALKARGC